MIILGYFFLFLHKNIIMLWVLLLMSTHKICFHAELGKIITQLSPNSPPNNSLCIVGHFQNSGPVFQCKYIQTHDLLHMVKVQNKEFQEWEGNL